MTTQIDASRLPEQLRSVLRWAATALDSALGEKQRAIAGAAPIEAAREAEALVFACLGWPRSALYADPERPLSMPERERLAEWLSRRCAGEPLAYLMGEREFWSLTFEVTPAVLVPRPETELLVEHALRAGRALDAAGVSSVHALDLGTGSGAIAIALAHEHADWQVTAIERSATALAVARRNAARHQLSNIELLEGHWYEPVAARRFHIIVSNPPYVAATDPLLGADSLPHEPRAALTPGDDAFADLAQLAMQAPQHLERGGYLLLEHGATQGPTVRELLVARGFAHVVSHRDLAGHERVTEGQMI